MLRVCSQKMLPGGLIRCRRVCTDDLRHRLGSGQVYSPRQESQLGKLPRFGGACSGGDEFIQDLGDDLPPAMTEYLNLIEAGVGFPLWHVDRRNLVDDIAMPVNELPIPQHEWNQPL